MSVVLDSTVSGSASNSYRSLAEADAFFVNRLYATNFTLLTDDDRKRTLIMATQRLDQEFFEGIRAVSTQSLKWPRWNVRIPNENYLFYGFYPIDSIPQPVKDAQCECALWLAGSDVLAEQGTQNFKSVKVGPIDVTFNQPTSSGRLPDQVMRLLRGLRVGAGGATLSRA